MLNNESVINVAKQMLNEGQSLENILSFFREEGVSKMQSIITFKKMTGVSLEEATVLVHSSTTWMDVAQNDEELIESFYDFLESDDL